MPQSVSSPKKLRAPGRRGFLLASACIAALATASSARAEDPTGGELVYGDGTIIYGDGTTTITQLSQKALITWLLERST